MISVSKNTRYPSFSSYDSNLSVGETECRNYTFKKLVITRANMLKLAEAYMTKTREEFPEKYFDELPSLCRHFMVLG